MDTHLRLSLKEQARLRFAAPAVGGRMVRTHQDSVDPTARRDDDLAEAMVNILHDLAGDDPTSNRRLVGQQDDAQAGLGQPNDRVDGAG